MPSKQKDTAQSTGKARVRQLTIKHKKKVIKSRKKVSGAPRIFARALKHLWQNKKVFGVIILIYIVLYILLVRGLAGHFELGDTRQAIRDALGSDINDLTIGAALFGALIGTAGTVSGEAAGVYQAVLFVVMSLACIWALRQTYEGKQKVMPKAAFYQGMQQLVPYILVALVIGLQLLPALIGVTLYGIVTSNGIAVGAFEQAIWFLVLLMSVALSIYLVSSSLFASYISTLPNMTPMNALRSARKLVRYRRFLVIRKVLFLPLVLLITAVALFLPLVIFAPIVAEVMFLAFILLLLPIVHTYFYMLYRELL